MKTPSNIKPCHVPCASGSNAQADCFLAPHGSLVRIIGHGTMDFTPRDAMDMARHMAVMAVECGYRNPDELAHLADFWRGLAKQCGWDDPMEDDGR